MLYPYLREIHSPITKTQLRPLSPKCHTVQFSKPLTEKDHEKLASFIVKYPRIQLRVYGHYFEKCDLGFLRHYPAVRHLAIDVFDLESLDPLSFISPSLKGLVLGQTKANQSLSFLQRFPHLRSLYIEGHTKDIAVIQTLSRLEHLTFRSITLPDLSLLKPLRNLLSLDIKLGGTTNLDLLPQIGVLRYLELWMVRGMANLKPIGSIRTLQYLFLQDLRNVRRLPSLAGLPLLRRVHLETMKGLTDLQSVAEAPALEELVVLATRQLEPESFRPFLGHPTLRKARIGLGSVRKNKAVKELLGLPTADVEFTFKSAGSRTKR